MHYQIGAHSALVSLGLEKYAEAVEGGPRNYIALSDILAGVAPFPIAAFTGGMHGVASDRPFSGSIAGLGGAMTGNMVGAAAGEALSAIAAQQLRQLVGKRLSTRQAKRLVGGLTTAGRRLGGVAGGTAGHYHATRHFGVHPSVRGDATPLGGVVGTNRDTRGLVSDDWAEKGASVNLTFQGVSAPHAAVRAALAKDPDTFTDWLESKEVMDDKGSPFSWNSDLSINARSLTNPKYDLHKNVAGDLWGMGDYHVPKPLTQAAAMKVIDELEQMHPGVNDHTNKMRKALQNLYARPDAKSVYLTYT